MEVTVLIHKNEFDLFVEIVNTFGSITIEKNEESIIEEYKWFYLDVFDTTDLFELGRRFEREIE